MKAAWRAGGRPGGGEKGVEIIDDLEVWFPTAEDVIIQKLRWARNKDFDDVVAILRVQTTLDFDQINHWCGIHETLPLLKKARAEADER
jgi:hypothetical protein